MRHALAPGTGDPAKFNIEDCSTQRNLNGAGRVQAEGTGNQIRARGIVFDQVMSSAWCRSFETAQLLEVGTPQILPALNSFFRDRSTAGAQTEQVREVLAAAEGRIMMVTHQVNITALTGEFVSSGEIFVIRLDENEVEVVGRILIDP